MIEGLAVEVEGLVLDGFVPVLSVEVADGRMEALEDWLELGNMVVIG